jgi:uncharacterized membrane protein
VRTVPTLRPLRWLAAGWRDMMRAGLPSLAHGLVVTMGGAAILALSMRWWALLPGAFSGFLLVGPILATGLYALSREIEAERRVRWSPVLSAWRCGCKPFVALGLLLVAAGTAWVLVSATLFGLFVSEPVESVRGFLRYVVTQPGHLFMLWSVLGGLGAALVFALTVVSAPLLLDRRIRFGAALQTSVRAVGENPVAMGLWASVILVATALSLATVMLGFLVTIPVIGHATWHAYRDVVDTAHLEPRV